MKAFANFTRNGLLGGGALLAFGSGAAQARTTDEAPSGNANAPDLDPSDFAQIEVLKGPQGTLYGAGAVGGLLKFVTSKPDFENITGRVSGSVSNAAKGDTG